MKDGKWLDPRYTSEEIFVKDYNKLDLSGMEVCCPGCRNKVILNRRTITGKTAAWCRRCRRAVTLQVK
ncbi:MAG: hypothetical protein NTY45_04135 [Elusimicrobia bacterium]|nr:hypothetical protein [Elusimicrobiota bacterium]